MFNPNRTFVSCLLLSAWLLFSPSAYSGPLPKSTAEMLQRLKIDPGILSDIDKELQVPQQWIEEAKKEGKLRVRGTSDSASNASVLYGPFKERYPFIQLEYTGSNQEDRVVKTLIAYKNGRSIGDVVESPGGKHIKTFKEANALQDISNVPGLQNVIPEAKDPEGLWIADGSRTYCLAYNTKLLQPKGLPKTWEDILTSPLLRNGNLALANRPENWAVSLWKLKGARWTKEFLGRLFAEVKPQLRKEGQNAMFPLLAVGEFHAVIPASNTGTARALAQGAPIGFDCPEPAPFLLSEMVAVKGPNVHATKLYLNWILSKEGQIARQVETSGTPVHQQLQRREFFPFADRILGKQRAFTNILDEEKIMPELTEFWNDLWLHGGKR